MNAGTHQHRYRQQPSLIPGARIVAKGKYEKRCKACKSTVLMMQITGQWVGLKWLAFDPGPVDIEPHRYFRVHVCNQPAPAPEAPAQQRLL